MGNMYYLKVGEYDVIVAINDDNIDLSFSKSSDKEFLNFTIPLDEQDEFLGGDY